MESKEKHLITSKQENGSAVILLPERFGHAEAAKYESIISKTVESGTPGKIIVDCTQLDFIDSIAIGVLVNSLRIVRNHKGTLVLRNLRGNALGLFRDASLDKLFIMEESTTPALDYSPENPSHRKLSIQTESQGNAVVFHLSGVVTFPDGAQHLKDVLLPEIRRGRSLILDLENLFLIDSASISDLLALNRRAIDTGAKLSLCNAKGYVGEIVENLNLTRLVRFHSSLRDAIAAAEQ